MPNYRYTWNRSWVAPYESLWSLLNKFAYFNIVSLQDVDILFDIRSNSKFDIRSNTKAYSILGAAPHTEWYLHSISSEVFNEKKLRKILDLKSLEIQKTVLNRIIPENDITWITSLFLRYCPVCITHGYHSILHQIYLIAECPIHGIDLIEQCPKCKQKNAYFIKSIKKIDPYTCDFCDYKFRITDFRDMETDVYRLNGLIIDEFKNDKMNHIVDWFKMFTNYRMSIPRKTLISRDKINIDEQNADDILSCCINLSGKKFPFDKRNLNRGRVLIHNIISYLPSKITYHVDYLSDYRNKDKIIEKELILIYKSIRRYFSKFIKVRHKKCIKLTKKNLFLHEFDEIMCSSSLGFELWQKYWGKRILLKYRACHLYWNTPITDISFINDTKIEMWLTRRIYSNNCFWTYIESIILTSNWIENRIDTDPDYYINEIKGITVPHWSIQINNIGEIIFHLWTKSKYLKALIRMKESSIKKHNRRISTEKPVKI